MALGPRRSSTPYVLYAVLAVLFLIATAHRVVTMTEHVRELRHGDELARDPFRIALPHPERESVEPEAERAGLKPGDQIVRINDRRFGYRGADLWVPMRAARAGDRLTVDAMRVSDSHPSPVAATIVLRPIIQLLFASIVFLFPLTMAYVIVVHRAMDVRVVVRQGLQYVLARGGIRLIQLTLLVAIALAATALLSGGAGFVRITIVVTAVAAVLALAGRFADRLRNWVDRRFFREAYNADLILSDTDGISEAIDLQDQEFGEERLAATVAAAQTLAPAALITQIMTAADAFAGKAPQYDDMTLVIARCLTRDAPSRGPGA